MGLTDDLPFWDDNENNVIKDKSSLQIGLFSNTIGQLLSTNIYVNILVYFGVYLKE